MAKRRLDQLLVERGLAESRAKAQALILSGKVFSGEQRLDKAGTALAADTALSLRTDEAEGYVSRGALKLLHALECFALDPQGGIAADIGASTGGFTDVLLQRGAARVYAIDVGHGQLAWRLRQDQRVSVWEKTNARHLTAEHVPEPLDFVVCDASFISLTLVLPAALARLKPGGWVIALIKPQFEVGRGEVGKGGVVRDPEQHKAVCGEIETWFTGTLGYRVAGIVQSPITGPKGNVEFLIAAQAPSTTGETTDDHPSTGG